MRFRNSEMLREPKPKTQPIESHIFLLVIVKVEDKKKTLYSDLKSECKVFFSLCDVRL